MLLTCYYDMSRICAPGWPLRHSKIPHRKVIQYPQIKSLNRQKNEIIINVKIDFFFSHRKSTCSKKWSRVFRWNCFLQKISHIKFHGIPRILWYAFLTYFITFFFTSINKSFNQLTFLFDLAILRSRRFSASPGGRFPNETVFFFLRKQKLWENKKIWDEI